MKTKKKLLIYKLIVIAFTAVLIIVPEVSNRVPEIDLRVLVTVIGVDKTERGIKTSAQIIIPMSEGEGQIKQEVISAEGKTVIEAFDMLSIAMGRKVELGHCGMIVLGHKLAEDNVLPGLKQLLASGMLSAGVNLVTTENIDAAEFIEQANKLSEASSSGISNFITYSTDGAHIATLTLLKFLSDSYDASGASYMPCIQIRDKTPEGTTPPEAQGESERENSKAERTKSGMDESDKQEGGKGVKGGGNTDKKKSDESQSSKNEDIKSEQSIDKSKQNEDKPKNKQFGEQEENGGGGGQSSKSQSSQSGGEEGGKTEIKSVESVVMFDFGKRIAKLDRIQTRGITWVDNKSDKGLVLIDDFKVNGESIGAISGQLKRKKVALKCSFEDGLPTITFDLSVSIQLDDKYKLIEYWKATRDSEKAMNSALADAFKEKIKSDITAGLNSIVDNNCDIMGLKSHFNRHSHKQYVQYMDKNPNNFLTDLIVKFNISTKIH